MTDDVVTLTPENAVLIARWLEELATHYPTIEQLRKRPRISLEEMGKHEMIMRAAGYLKGEEQ